MAADFTTIFHTHLGGEVPQPPTEPPDNQCPACAGTGKRVWLDPDSCPACAGTGYVPTSFGRVRCMLCQRCPTCEGRGSLVGKGGGLATCWNCKGTRRSTVPQVARTVVPARR